MSEYNVIGPKEKLAEMLVKFKLIKIIDKFEPNDWNVQLPEDPSYEDDFIEWCEENNISFKLL